MDDITFCLSDCQRTDCYRHPSNIQDRTIPHSYADFKGTETCPEKMQLSEEDATKDATLQQDMSGNMSGTHKSLDCISRQAAIDALNKMKIYRPLDSDRYVISDCLNRIVNLPPVQPQSKREWYQRGYEAGQKSVQPQKMRGKWIPQGWNDTYCKCSCCDAVYVTAEIPYNYCPNCGADMRETE